MATPAPAQQQQFLEAARGGDQDRAGRLSRHEQMLLNASVALAALPDGRHATSVASAARAQSIGALAGRPKSTYEFFPPNSTSSRLSAFTSPMLAALVILLPLAPSTRYPAELRLARSTLVVSLLP